jgi:hypothetical protein
MSKRPRCWALDTNTRDTLVLLTGFDLNTLVVRGLALLSEPWVFKLDIR